MSQQMAKWTTEFRRNLFKYSTEQDAAPYKAPEQPEEGDTLVPLSELKDFGVVLDGQKNDKIPTFDRVWSRVKTLAYSYPNIEDVERDDGMISITRFEFWEIACFLGVYMDNYRQGSLDKKGPRRVTKYMNTLVNAGSGEYWALTKVLELFVVQLMYAETYIEYMKGQGVEKKKWKAKQASTRRRVTR